MTTPPRKPLNSVVKIALEVGPLAVFFLTFRYADEILAQPAMFALIEGLTGTPALKGPSGPVFVATLSFMLAIAVSLGASLWLTRTIPRMAALTAIVVAVFGGLTLWLTDESFIKMKPTIVNSIFALILGIGLIQGRSYLKYLLGEAMPLTDRGWMVFTGRWVLFFIFLAALNEAVWRTQSTDTWVTVKTFVGPALTFAFVLLNLPFLQRHALSEAK